MRPAPVGRSLARRYLARLGVSEVLQRIGWSQTLPDLESARQMAALSQIRPFFEGLTNSARPRALR